MSYDLIVFDWSGTLSPIDSSPTDTLYPEVLGVLEMLHRQGILLAVATMLPKGALMTALKHTGLSQFFTTTASGSDYLAKPNPEMLNAIIDFCGVSSSSAIMIGDSVADLQMANLAGVKAIGIDRYGDGQQFQSYRPEKIIQTFEGLPKFFSR